MHHWSPRELQDPCSGELTAGLECWKKDGEPPQSPLPLFAVKPPGILGGTHASLEMKVAVILSAGES
jgi:hypothetical protein